MHVLKCVLRLYDSQIIESSIITELVTKMLNKLIHYDSVQDSMILGNILLYDLWCTAIINSAWEELGLS